MKCTILVLCFIAVISAIGAVFQKQEQPPTQSQTTEFINAEKETEIPTIKPVTPTTAVNSTTRGYRRLSSQLPLL